ncbi:MAG: DUF6508 domain-containing protein [Vicinamibacterales bacterium]
MPSHQRLHAIAQFLPTFEASEFEAASSHVSQGDESATPWEVPSEVVQKFVEAAYEHGWVRSGFKWGEWQQTDEAIQLLRDPEAISSADAEQLARVLTVVIRRDRFNEGSLIYDFRSGLITRIVRRAAVLAGEGST